MHLNFIRPCANSIFDNQSHLGIKLLKRLRVGLSHLHEHKFRHCFQNTLSFLCECDKDAERTMHSFSITPNLSLLDNPSFRKLGILIITFKTQLTQSLLYGYQNYHSVISRLIIILTIKYLMSTERFKCLIFN